jgi:hypothetical protein
VTTPTGVKVTIINPPERFVWTEDSALRPAQTAESLQLHLNTYGDFVGAVYKRIDGTWRYYSLHRFGGFEGHAATKEQAKATLLALLTLEDWA